MSDILFDTQTFLDQLRLQNWNPQGGPMRMSGKLKLEDYAPAEMPANVRWILTLLRDEGGTDATATGNLNRAFVGRVFEKLSISKKRREMIVAVNKVINEMDVMPLHLARVVAEAAGLVVKRKKRFHATAKGKALLAESNAGEFYRVVFVAYFNKFNLNYLGFYQEIPAIQDTMPAILWRIDQVFKEWRFFKGACPEILLPNPLKLLREVARPEILTEDYIVQDLVIDPLFQMGLMEQESGAEFLFRTSLKKRCQEGILLIACSHDTAKGLIKS